MEIKQPDVVLATGDTVVMGESEGYVLDGNDEELSHIQQPQPASSDLFRSIWSAFSISEAEFLA